jgi:hypothetical protein
MTAEHPPYHDELSLSDASEELGKKALQLGANPQLCSAPLC